ncbi:MAG: hypothetical protein QOH03_4937 [Kribbellaceae bacterium]|nr:hypothetical protein [Kribbellaceae bacterium]
MVSTSNEVQYSLAPCGVTTNPTSTVTANAADACANAFHCRVTTKSPKNTNGVNFTPAASPTQTPRPPRPAGPSKSYKTKAQSIRLTCPNPNVSRTGSRMSDPATTANKTGDLSTRPTLNRHTAIKLTNVPRVHTETATPHGTTANGTITTAANGG